MPKQVIGDNSERPSLVRKLGDTHFVPNSAALQANAANPDKGRVIADTFRNTHDSIKDRAAKANEAGDAKALSEADKDMRDLYGNLSNHMRMPIDSNNFDKAINAIGDRERNFKLASAQVRDIATKSAPVVREQSYKDETLNKRQSDTRNMRNSYSYGRSRLEGQFKTITDAFGKEKPISKDDFLPISAFNKKDKAPTKPSDKDLEEVANELNNG